MSKKLLAETVYTDADFDRLFAPVKKALGHFGKTVSASAKLIGNDVATLMKLTMHWKLRSLDKQREIMNKWEGDRSKYLKEVSDNSMAALDGMGPEKYTAMVMFPGVFWTSKAVGIPAVADDARIMAGEYGFNKLPGIGPLFQGESSGGKSFWDGLIDSDEEPGSEKSQEQHERLIQNHLIKHHGYEPKDFRDDRSGLSNFLHKINDIFLFSIFDSVQHPGHVIEEGEEIMSERDQQIEELKEVFMQMLPGILENTWTIDREGYLKEHRKTYEPAIKTVEAILSTNTSLATSSDADEFFKVLETAAQNHEELKGMDINSLKEEFNKMVMTLSEDQNVIEQLRKDLEKSGELKNLAEGDEVGILSDKEKPIFEKHLKQIALDNIKGQFLPVFKEGAIDLYDDMRFRITDGLQEDTMKELRENDQTNEVGIKFLDQIEEFQKRLDASLSKLK